MGYKVLIVDDEFLTRKGIIAKLNWSELGISNIEEASDGVEALEIIELVKPDIVITDVKMPRMGGIELVKNISNRMITCRCIIISAYSDFSYAKDALKLKVNDYILKPVDPTELEETVRHAICSLRKQESEKISGILSGEGNSKFYSDEVNKELSLYLRMNDYRMIENVLDQVTESCVSNKLSPEYIYTIIIGLNSICLSYIAEMNVNIEEVLGKNFSPLKAFYDGMSIHEAINLTKSMYEKTVCFFKTGNFSKSKSIALKAKDYINENYSDPKLSLKKIAKDLLISHEYLRHSFKKIFSITITNYIIQVRMHKAKELIQYENYKLSDICEYVGIPDPSYFTKCFKKYYGISPSSYKNMSRELH